MSDRFAPLHLPTASSLPHTYSKVLVRERESQMVLGISSEERPKFHLKVVIKF